MCGAGARPDELSIVLFDDEYAIDTVVGMVDKGKCSAMAPGNFYLEKILGGEEDVEVFIEYHSIKYARECMTLRPSEVRWNVRKHDRVNFNKVVVEGRA